MMAPGLRSEASTVCPFARVIPAFPYTDEPLKTVVDFVVDVVLFVDVDVDVVEVDVDVKSACGES